MKGLGFFCLLLTVQVLGEVIHRPWLGGVLQLLAAITVVKFTRTSMPCTVRLGLKGSEVRIDVLVLAILIVAASLDVFGIYDRAYYLSVALPVAAGVSHSFKLERK